MTSEKNNVNTNDEKVDNNNKNKQLGHPTRPPHVLDGKS